MSDVLCPQCATACDPAHRFCHVCGFPISELQTRADDPLLGTTLPGGYVILELIGVGGMGRVYRAEQKALGRTVAVKIIHPHLLGDESASVRFITEARAASRLNHPNIVSVFDFGKSGNQLYLVMEFLRGRDLARVDYEEGPLPFRRIVDIMCQVLAGLAEAHHLGIIHRDLKPENVVLEPMRTGGDFVKVVDFGLAKMREVPSTHITSPGIVCGTPDYMSPEQGRGDPIDGRSDLYTCGVLLFQLLTGRLPFESESPTQVVLMHLTVPPPNPLDVAPARNIPLALVDVTLRAMEKEVSRRYQTADEFTIALRSAAVMLDRGAPPPSVDEPGVACGSCGTIAPRNQKFCGECGARISREAPLSQPRRIAPVSAGPPPRVRLSSLPELPLPFVGRERDLEWLDSFRFDVDRTLATARIVGEGGTGKTRLLQEFIHLASVAGDFVVLTRPDPWGADVGYYVLRESIVALASLPPGGGEPHEWRGATPEARAGLMAIFGKQDRSAPQPSVNMWSKPPAGIVLPDDRRFTAAEALRWAIMRAHESNEGRLVLLAIDDLHAVDGASRNAFADVVVEPPIHPLLVVSTHLPGFDPGWAGATRVLEGLPLDLISQMVSQPLAATLGQGGGRSISPLYLDQVLRFSSEGGTNPPARLGDLVAQRIERLPPEARRVLQAVSVLGDDAQMEDIERLLPSDRNTGTLLAVLRASGMIEQELGGFRAAHPLLREIALATTPVAVRRDLHVRALEGRDGEPLPLPLEVRALHAYHAQDTFEALMLLEQVADRAGERGDRAGAILALRRGLDLARRELFRGELDEPEKAVIIFSRKLGEALARASALTDADGVLREALDLAAGGIERARLLAALAFVAHERGRAKEALTFQHQALDLARSFGSSDLMASLERMRADWNAG
ncbi:protein kinase domain-containing protein [Polyangium mundeleinium]|uniref:Protein kinase n=1 Tax=Polyangium mundeleinium TaxID=2995306 RepID=A0ABT5EYV2_9BACT|nr:protein kinase [Polyangium mundeleinium]MDC0747019.1 protein kinase [Polyangium mundeleinium]